jgi:hypothetical protein
MDRERTHGKIRLLNLRTMNGGTLRYWTENEHISKVRERSVKVTKEVPNMDLKDQFSLF